MYVCTRLGDTALPRKPRSAEPQRDSACKYRSQVGVSFVGFFAELFRTPVNSSETTSVDLTECTDHSAAVCRLSDFFSPGIPRAGARIPADGNSIVSSISLAVLGIILPERRRLTHRRHDVSCNARKSYWTY